MKGKAKKENKGLSDKELIDKYGDLKTDINKAIRKSILAKNSLSQKKKN